MLKGVLKGLAWGGGLLGVSLGALWASGFPARIGLTKAESRLSLSGDLVFPVAGLQGDRVCRVAADPRQIWPQLLAVEELYADLWDRPLELVYEERDELLVWKTGPGEEVPWEATLSVTIMPSTDSVTTVHLRERYVAGDEESETAIRILRLSTGAFYPQVRRLVRRSAKKQ